MSFEKSALIFNYFQKSLCKELNRFGARLHKTDCQAERSTFIWILCATNCKQTRANHICYTNVRPWLFQKHLNINNKIYIKVENTFSVESFKNNLYPLIVNIEISDIICKFYLVAVWHFHIKNLMLSYLHFKNDLCT